MFQPPLKKSSDMDCLMTEDQTAQYLQFTPRALQKWRLDGSGPKYVKISGRAVRYRKQDLDEWIEHRIRRSTSDPGLEIGV